MMDIVIMITMKIMNKINQIIVMGKKMIMFAFIIIIKVSEMVN